MPLLTRLRRADPLVAALLPLLVFAVLWKGGKSLETTWLLTGVAWMLTVHQWRRSGGEGDRVTVPLLIWCSAIGFVLWTILAQAASQTANYGLDEVLRDGSLVLIFFWVTRRVASRTNNADFEHFAVTLVSAACVAAVVGIFVYTLQPVNRFVGTFFDARFHTDYWPNAWAQLMLLAWPLAAWRALQAPSITAKRVRCMLVALLLGSLFLSYSRGAMIAFGGQIAFGAVLLSLWEYKRAMILRLPLWLIAIACAASALFLAVNLARDQFYNVQSVAEKVTFTADEGGSSVSERRQFWSQALTMSIRRPFLGWGPYSFRFVQPSMQRGVLATSDHPHNVFLKYAAERGMPAALFFVALLALLATVVFRPGFSVPLPLVIGVTGVLAHNLIDFNLQFVGIALPWWIALGCLFGYAMRNQKSLYGERKKLITNFVRFSEILLAIGLVAIAILETPPMLLSSLGRHAQAAGDDTGALVWYGAAAGQIFSRDLHLSRTQILFNQGRYDEAMSVIGLYRKQNPHDPRAWTLTGRIHEAQEELSMAQKAYGMAYEKNKWNSIAAVADVLRVQETLHDMDAGGKRQEYEQLLRAFAEAIDHNVHFIALGPNPEAFQEAAARMERFFPDGSPAYEVLAAKVSRRATEERAKLKARPPGWLW